METGKDLVKVIDHYKSAITNPLEYPGDIPPCSFLHLGTHIFELKLFKRRRLNQAKVIWDHDRFEGIEAHGNSESLNKVLRRFRATSMAWRIPVVAYSTNANPPQLTRKYFPSRTGVNELIPVIRAKLHDVDLVYSAHVASYGAIPITPIKSNGACTRVFVMFVDSKQLELLMHPEKDRGTGDQENFKLVHVNVMDSNECRLELEDSGETFSNYYIYLSRKGILSLPDKRPIQWERKVSGDDDKFTQKNILQYFGLKYRNIPFGRTFSRYLAGEKTTNIERRSEFEKWLHDEQFADKNDRDEEEKLKESKIPYKDIVEDGFHPKYVDLNVSWGLDLKEDSGYLQIIKSWYRDQGDYGVHLPFTRKKTLGMGFLLSNLIFSRHIILRQPERNFSNIEAAYDPNIFLVASIHSFVSGDHLQFRRRKAFLPDYMKKEAAFGQIAIDQTIRYGLGVETGEYTRITPIEIDWWQVLRDQLVSVTLAISFGLLIFLSSSFSQLSWNFTSLLFKLSSILLHLLGLPISYPFNLGVYLCLFTVVFIFLTSVPKMFFKRRYMIMRVQIADVTTMETKSCVMEMIGMEMLGVQAGDEVELEGIRSKNNKFYLRRETLRVFATPDAMRSRRENEISPNIHTLYPDCEECLGVVPDLPWIFIDEETRINLGLKANCLPIRVRARRDYQITKEGRDIVIVVMIGLIGIAGDLDNPIVVSSIVFITVIFAAIRLWMLHERISA